MASDPSPTAEPARRHSAICWLFGFRSTASPQHPAARDHVAFAQELARPVHDDERVGRAGRTKYLDLSADDDEERDRFVHQHVSADDRASPPVHRNARDLRTVRVGNSRSVGEAAAGRSGCR